MLISCQTEDLGAQVFRLARDVHFHTFHWRAKDFLVKTLHERSPKMMVIIMMMMMTGICSFIIYL